MSAFLSFLRTVCGTTHQVYPNDTPRDKLNRLKYIARSLYLRKVSEPWIQELKHPKLAPLLKADGRLYSKLQWPYLNKDFTDQQKLEALTNHYRFVTECFSNEILEDLCKPFGWSLCSFEMEGLGEITLGVRFNTFEKEGDLSITLACNRRWIHSLSFTITHWTPERREILIGGIQGHTEDREHVIEITRGLHGLRPKAMLIFAIQQFASLWNITRIKAVANEMHIYRSPRKMRQINADYDVFWEESGGVKDHEGAFILPLIPEQKNIAELKPNKRSVYRKRYAMLATLSDKIHGRPPVSNASAKDASDAAPLA